MNPSASILIPVFNGARFIHKALRSAVDQVEADEIIVVDNCSTDETLEIVRSFADSRLRVFRNDRNLGLFGNFNACLEKSSSDLIVFLCADDALSPGSVAEAKRFFQIHPTTALLNMVGIGENLEGKEITRLGSALRPGLYDGPQAAYSCFRHLLETGSNVFNFPAGIYLNRKLLAGMRFDDHFEKCGDIHFYFRALQTGPLGQSEFVGCRVSFHDQQLSQVHKHMSRFMDEYLWMTGPKIFPRLADQQRQRLISLIAALGYGKSSIFLFHGNISAAADHFWYAKNLQFNARAGVDLMLFLLRKLSKKILRFDHGPYLQPLYETKSMNHQMKNRIKRLLKKVVSKVIKNKSVQYKGVSITGSFTDYGILKAISSGGHERYFEKLLLESLKPGHVFVDIGAHLGKYSLLAGRKLGHSGRVLAFEPHPRTFSYLQRNILDNQCTTTVKAYNLAISSQHGEMHLYADFLQSDYTSLLSVRDSRDTQVITVQTRRLDEIESNLLIDCMKIDVEGAENIVLGGCRPVIEASRKSGRQVTLFIESNPDALHAAGTSPAELLRTLKDLKFARIQFIDESRQTLEDFSPQFFNQCGNLICAGWEPAPSSY